MDLSFRKPNKADLEIYNRIYNSYRFYPEKQNDKLHVEQLSETGFLVGDPVSDDNWKKAIYTECALIGGKVAGLIRVEKFSSEMCSEHFKLEWLGTYRQWKCFTKESELELGVIIVDSKFKGKSVAKILLERLFKFMRKNKNKYLYSWVVTNPENKPSISFHKKMGFREIAVYSADESFGIKNYQSKLFLKEL